MPTFMRLMCITDGITNRTTTGGPNAGTDNSTTST
jgi:hypothetical protein